MKFEAVPTVTLRLDWMSQEMIAHLGIEGSQLAEAISEKIKQKFGELMHDIDMDIENAVKRSISEKILQCVNDYFKYGPGSEYIYEKIEKILREKFPSDES